MCCKRLAGNTGRKNDAKNRHLCTIAHELCRAVSSQLRHVSTIGKNLLNINISPTCPHNMANVGPLTAEIISLVWGTPANFNQFRVLPSLLQRRRSAEANQTLHDVWPSPRLVHYIYIFGSSYPLTEFCPVQNSLYFQLLRSSILAVLLQSTPPASVSQALRRGTRNGITELSQRAPPIFGWAAIALGIGPHSSMVALCNRADHYIFILFLSSSSSFFFLLSFFPCLISAVRNWMFTILWHIMWP